MREFTKDLYHEDRVNLLTKLAPYDKWIPFKPGETERLPLTVQIVEKETDTLEGTKPHLVIQSILFLGEERLHDSTDEDQLENWVDIFGPSKITAQQIRSRLSENYAIPEWAIQLENPHINSTDRLTIPASKVLKLERPPYPEE